MPTTLADCIRARRDVLQDLVLATASLESKWDNRPGWDNTSPKFDNRPSWDNWDKS